MADNPPKHPFPSLKMPPHGANDTAHERGKKVLMANKDHPAIKAASYHLLGLAKESIIYPSTLGAYIQDLILDGRSILHKEVARAMLELASNVPGDRALFIYDERIGGYVKTKHPDPTLANVTSNLQGDVKDIETYATNDAIQSYYTAPDGSTIDRVTPQETIEAWKTLDNATNVKLLDHAFDFLQAIPVGEHTTLVDMIKAFRTKHKEYTLAEAVNTVRPMLHSICKDAPSGMKRWFDRYHGSRFRKVRDTTGETSFAKPSDIPDNSNNTGNSPLQDTPWKPITPPSQANASNIATVTTKTLMEQVEELLRTLEAQQNKPTSPPWPPNRIKDYSSYYTGAYTADSYVSETGDTIWIYETSGLYPKETKNTPVSEHAKHHATFVMTDTKNTNPVIDKKSARYTDLTTDKVVRCTTSYYTFTGSMATIRYFLSHPDMFFDTITVVYDPDDENFARQFMTDYENRLSAPETTTVMYQTPLKPETKSELAA